MHMTRTSSDAAASVKEKPKLIVCSATDSRLGMVHTNFNCLLKAARWSLKESETLSWHSWYLACDQGLIGVPVHSGYSSPFQFVTRLCHTIYEMHNSATLRMKCIIGKWCIIITLALSDKIGMLMMSMCDAPQWAIFVLSLADGLCSYILHWLECQMRCFHEYAGTHQL